MTAKRAECLTGYEIRRMAEKSGKVTYGAFRDDEFVVTGTHRIDELALRVLVKEIYKLHAIEVLKQNNWRCARCGGPWRLQIHHRRDRSHGGTPPAGELGPGRPGFPKIIH